MKGAWQLRMSALALAGAAALGACGGSSSGPTSNTTITQGEAAAIGTAAAQQIGGLTGGLASFQVSNPSGGVITASVPIRFRAASRMISVMATVVPPAKRGAVLKLFGTTGGCNPSVAGDTTDANGNGIPSNVTYTFAAANCTLIQTDTDVTTGAITKITYEANGTWHLQDLAGANVLWGYNFGLGNWTFTEVDSSATIQNSFTLGINGSTGASVQTSTGSTGSNFVYSYSIGGSKLYQSNVNWNVGFTPANGAVIDTSAATLPAGQFAISGSFGWSSSDPSSGATGSWNFSLGATSPLGYDGSCTADPPFDSGVVQGLITGATNVGFTLTFSGCGIQPTVQVL